MQFAIPLAHPAGFTAPSIGPTGQNCYGYNVATASSVACSASITVNTSDVLVGLSTFGDNSGGGRLISGVTCSSGTATISWSPDANSVGRDTTNVQANEMFYGVVTSGGTCTPQLSWSNSHPYQGLHVEAFSGLTGTLDVSNGNYNSGSTSTNGNVSGSVITTVNGELVVGGFWDTAGATPTLTAGTSSLTYTTVRTHSSDGAEGIEYAIQATAGSGTAADWTTSSSNANVCSVEALR